MENDKIVGEERMGARTVRRIVYEPGNGSRYSCILTECPGSNGEPGFLFCWMKRQDSGGNAIWFGRDRGLLHYSYLAEKMEIDLVADAAALLALIRDETGRPVGMPPEFGEDGIWIHRHR